MSTTPDSGFVKGMVANLAYWRERLADLTDEKIKEISPDHPNLRRAVAFGLVLAQTHRLTAELSLAAFPLIEQGGHWESWIPLLERLLAHTTLDDISLRFHLSKRLGQLLRFNGQIAQAITNHERAMQLAQQLNDPQATAEAYLNLSEDYRLQGNYEKAKQDGLTALELLSTLPEAESLRLATLNILGIIAWNVQDMEKAEARLAEVVFLARSSQRPTYLARALNNLALAQQAREKFDEAFACYQEALSLLANTASELDKTKVLLSLGKLQFDLAQYDQAEASFRQADSLALRQSGDTSLRAVLGQNLGNVLLKQERYIEAEIHLNRSLLWRRAEGRSVALGNTLGTLAEVLAAGGRLDEACAAYEEAVALLAHYPDDAWARKLSQQFSLARARLNCSAL